MLLSVFLYASALGSRALILWLFVHSKLLNPTNKFPFVINLLDSISVGSQYRGIHAGLRENRLRVSVLCWIEQEKSLSQVHGTWTIIRYFSVQWKRNPLWRLLESLLIRNSTEIFEILWDFKRYNPTQVEPSSERSKSNRIIDTKYPEVFEKIMEALLKGRALPRDVTTDSHRTLYASQPRLLLILSFHLFDNFVTTFIAYLPANNEKLGNDCHCCSKGKMNLFFRWSFSHLPGNWAHHVQNFPILVRDFIDTRFRRQERRVPERHCGKREALSRISLNYSC